MMTKNIVVDGYSEYKRMQQILFSCTITWYLTFVTTTVASVSTSVYL